MEIGKTTPDEDELRQTIQDALLTCLTPSLFKVYPRHRWVGCEVATDQLALTESIHGLLSASFLHMAGSVISTPGESPTSGGQHTGLGPGTSHRAEDPEPGELRGQVGADDDQDLPDVVPSGRLADSELGMPGPSSQTVEGASAEENTRRMKAALSFLDASPLAHMLIIRLCMKPTCQLLHDHIARSGHHWEEGLLQNAAREVLHQGSVRSSTTRLQEYVNLTSERKMLRSLSELLRSPDWQHVPSAQWTLALQTVAFKMTSRLGAMVHQQLVLPSQQAPCRLFGLLSDATLAQQLQQTPTCMRDPFTTAFLNKYPGEELGKQESLAALSLIAQSMATDTVSIEWTHGRIARLVNVQKVQTHVPSMSWLNGQLLGQKHWMRRVKHNSLLVNSVRKKLKASRSSRQKSTADATSHKKAPSTGGAFRAYISMKARGHKGTPDFRLLAEDFREARATNSGEYQEAMRMGQAGTALHQETGEAPFGQTSRQIRRKRARVSALAGALTTASTSLQHVAQASRVGEMSEVQYSFDLVEAARTATARARLVSTAKAQEQRRAQQQLETWRQEVAPALEQACYSAFPELLEVSAMSLNAMPSKHYMHFDIVPDLLAQASEVSGWSQEHARSSNLRKTFLGDWDHKNKVIFESGAVLPSEAVPAARTSKCLKQGYCSCTPEGKRCRKLLTTYYNLLKGRFPSRGDARKKQALREGDIALLLHGTKEGAETQERLGGSDSPRPGRAERLLGDVWLHIAWHSFKPYRSTLQSLRYVDRVGANRIRLEQEQEFWADHELLARLDAEAAWTVSFYELKSTSQPMVTLNPAQCLVEKLQGSDQSIWPPQRKERRCRREAASEARARAPHEAAAGASQAPPPGSDMEVTHRDAQASDQESEPSDGSEEEQEGQDSQAGEEAELRAELEALALSWHEAPQDLDELDIADAAVVEEEAGEATAEDVLLEKQDTHTEEEAADPALSANKEEGRPSSSGAAAAASSDAAPDAAADTQDAPQNRRIHVPAQVVFDVPGGKLTFYSKGYITATCSNPRHGKCVMSRSTLVGRALGQGRPLGLMKAWLQLGRTCPSKEAHWDKSLWPDLAARRLARVELETMDGALDILGCERPQRPGEGSEPDVVL